MTFALTEQELDRLFPAHVRTDSRGRIVGLGPSLSSRVEGAPEGRLLTDVFDVQRPLGLDELEDLLCHDLRLVLALKSNPRMRLQGVVFRKCDAVYFLLGHVPNIDDVEGQPSYRFSDFAPFDGSKDMFLAAQIRKGLLNDTRELMEKLEAEKQAAERANHAKSEFLGCMSHEIRTPLNGVLGLAALLERTRLDEAQQRLIAGVTRSGKNLLALLNDIIDISRMEADQIAIEMVEFCLGDIETALHDGFAAICQEKGLEFHISLADALATQRLIGDDIRILQVLNNLVSNAVKFTAQGMVTVDIFCDDREVAGVSAVRFVVRDTGIGMTREECARVFEPFVQADVSITRRYGGTGLGLSICERLCDMMHGRIWVESEHGEGSAFHVALPLEAAAAPLRASG